MIARGIFYSMRLIELRRHDVRVRLVGRGTGDLDQDREALSALYNATGGPDWTDNTGWATGDSDLASWYGLTINETDLFVSEVDLSGNNLQGQTSFVSWVAAMISTIQYSTGCSLSLCTTITVSGIIRAVQ